MNGKRFVLLLALSLLCLSALATRHDAQQVDLQAKNNPNKPVNKIIHLAPPAAGAVEPNATGIAKIQVKKKGNAQQRFQVVGANLKAGAAYTLFVTVNGASVQVATETAEVDEDEGKDEDESGAAVEFIFFQKAKGKIGDDERPLPAALDPLTQITAVTLKDAAGNVVLSGNFPQ
jgi:hypothetical protein